MKNIEREVRKEAVALSYDKAKKDAPRIIAKGKGLIAEGILEQANAQNIPVHEDGSLVELLGKLNINEQIPEDLYQAVAEVFAFIYKVDQATGGKNNI